MGGNGVRGSEGGSKEVKIKIPRYLEKFLAVFEIYLLTIHSKKAL